MTLKDKAHEVQGSGIANAPEEARVGVRMESMCKLISIYLSAVVASVVDDS